MATVEKIVPAQGITVHTDKHGVTREYREVKRKANVGELVKVTEHAFYPSTAGAIVEVTGVNGGGHVSYRKPYDGAGTGSRLEQYVVLEPTDIIHYDGKRWRDVKRKARVGELINMFDHHHTPVQGIRLVTSIDPEADSVHFWVDGTRFGTPYIRSGQSKPCYTVLEPADQPSATVAERIEALERRVDALESEMKRGKTIIHNGPVTLTFSSSDIPKQYTREQVIEVAKKDVEELKKSWDHTRYLVDGHICCNAEFIVNRKKHTVVCLLRGHISNLIFGKGIAKSAPDDCFNVHIGKSIALRRALGLSVPDYYVNAPKPTEVQKGDIVQKTSKTKWPGHRVTVRSLVDYWIHDLQNGYVMVIDDSHDFGGEGIG